MSRELELSPEIELVCPYCPSDATNKLYANIELGVFHCYRCEFSGKIDSLKYNHPVLYSELEDLSALPLYAKVNAYNKEPEFDSTVKDDLKGSTSITELDREYYYLLERGWTDASIHLYRPLKSSNTIYKDRAIIPVVDRKNTVIYYTARDISNKAKQKYINPASDKNFIFYSKTPLDSVYSDIAFIGEGVFDMFKIPGGCALLGKTLNKKQHNVLYEFLKPRKSIYICLDPGTRKDADALAIEIDSWFSDKEIHIMKWVDSKTSKLDLGDLSKTYTERQLIRFIQDNSSPARLMRLF